MKKKAEFATEDGERTKVYWNNEWNEFVVRFYNKDGVHMDASDYHTDDEEDAMNTAGIEHLDVVRVL